VARSEGRIQPLCAVYAPAALDVLAAAPDDEPLIRTVERLRPAVVDVEPEVLHNVNAPADLERAAALLG
jgi:molybdopterin-guanine dinucleotide biosynthesis protein A